MRYISNRIVYHYQNLLNKDRKTIQDFALKLFRDGRICNVRKPNKLKMVAIIKSRSNIPPPESPQENQSARTLDDECILWEPRSRCKQIPPQRMGVSVVEIKYMLVHTEADIS